MKYTIIFSQADEVKETIKDIPKKELMEKLNNIERKYCMYFCLTNNKIDNLISRPNKVNQILKKHIKITSKKNIE